MSKEVARMPAAEVAVSAEATSILSVIERAARSADVDVEKMERLFALQERFVAKQAEADFNAAMSRVQSKVGRVAANRENSQTRSRYADYAAIDRLARPVYVEEGFSVSFSTDESPRPDCIRVMAYVSHRTGHTRTYHVDMPADGKGAKGGDVMTKTHATGSATAYGMRYLLKMIWNIAIGDDDNDGNGAGSENIGPGQAADIEALIEEVGANREMFLRYMQVHEVAEIPLNKYRAAVAALEAKRNRA